MGRFEVGSAKGDAAAKFAPLAIAVAIFTVPAQAESSGNQPYMTFDAIGSILQDMDREQSLVDTQDHSDIFPEGHASEQTDHACQTADVDARMDEIYAQLKTRLESIDLPEIAAFEAQIVFERGREIELARLQQKELALDARASAERAAAGIRAAIAEMEEQQRLSASRDTEMVTAAVAEALRAVEAALENQP